MTPRQLMALCDAHREFEGAANRGGQPVAAQRQSAPRANGQGGAGWLMAVSTGLDRNRKARAQRVNTVRAPILSAPGVG